MVFCWVKKSVCSFAARLKCELKNDAIYRNKTENDFSKLE